MPVTVLGENWMNSPFGPVADMGAEDTFDFHPAGREIDMESVSIVSAA
jgi:hypothetical protein